MPRPRERVRLENGLKLNVNKLMRDGCAKSGELRRRSISWTRIPSGEVVARGWIEIDLRSEPFGWLELELGKIKQKIQLRAVSRNFGGCQWYLMCPQTGKDASVLWLPPGANRFQSRQSWGRQVAYGSQFETRYDRALSAAQNIRYRLGGKNFVSLMDDIPPPKPKWMRWRTYDKMMQRCGAYEDIANDRLVEIVSRLQKYR